MCGIAEPGGHDGFASGTARNAAGGPAGPVAVRQLPASAGPRRDPRCPDLRRGLLLPPGRRPSPEMGLHRPAARGRLRRRAGLVAAAPAGPGRAGGRAHRPLPAGPGRRIRRPTVSSARRTAPIELPGIVLAALATLALGAVLGPEGPLIAIGGGLSAWRSGCSGADAPAQAVAVVGAAGSFAAVSHAARVATARRVPADGGVRAGRRDGVAGAGPRPARGRNRSAHLRRAGRVTGWGRSRWPSRICRRSTGPTSPSSVGAGRSGWPRPCWARGIRWLARDAATVGRAASGALVTRAGRAVGRGAGDRLRRGHRQERLRRAVLRSGRAPATGRPAAPTTRSGRCCCWSRARRSRTAPR